jgi:hypothetical protein
MRILFIPKREYSEQHQEAERVQHRSHSTFYWNFQSANRDHSHLKAFTAFKILAASSGAVVFLPK